MRLRYETTARDQIAKLDRYARSSPVSRRFMWFAYFTICGMAWLSAGLFYVKQGDRSLGWVAYASLAALLTVSLPRLYRWYQESFWKSVLTPESLRGLVGPTELALDDEHVEEIGPVCTVRVAWRDVMEIERDAERTLILVAPMLAIAVPHEAFATDVEREGFEQTIRERFAASRA